MTPLLEDRVAAYLVDHPDADFWAIIRAVPGREQTLRDILASPLFEERQGRWRIAGTSGKRERQSFGPVLSQKQRILAVLRDGRWHTATELYRTGCVLHSRISDLRNKDGYLIERRHIGGIGADAHEYRLLDSATRPLVAESSGPAPVASPASATDSGQAAHPDGQLALTGAAFRRGGN